jgi:hypothetical protein
LTALPVGLESLDEGLYLELAQSLEPRAIFEGLVLPRGLRLLSVKRLPRVGPKPRVLAARYELATSDPRLAQAPLCPEALLRYTGSKGGPKEYRLGEFVREASMPAPGSLRLTIRVAADGTPKPLPAVRALWSLPEDWTAPIKKIATILDLDPRP